MFTLDNMHVKLSASGLKSKFHNWSRLGLGKLLVENIYD